MLAGCGGSQRPIGVPGAMPQTMAIATHADRGKSWMLPGTSGEDLLYVSNPDKGTVTVYSYESQQLVGTLTGFKEPWGVCATNQRVWVTDRGTGDIIEYSHGGTKHVRVLKSDSQNVPLSCAHDPKSGNLAVTNRYNLAVFLHGKGKPKYYTGANAGIDNFMAASYDEKGNLWINGWTYDSASYMVPRFAELPRNASSLSAVRLDGCNKNNCPAAVWSQWVGKTWLVNLDVWHVGRDLHGKLLDYIGLDDYGDGSAFFVTIPTASGSQQFIGADDYEGGPNGSVQYWDYPSGGEPTATITDGIDEPFGVTVSYAS